MKKIYSVKSQVEETAILVQVILRGTKKEDAADSLLELERLADTAGVSVKGFVTQHRNSPTPQFFIGEGKLDEIQMACKNSLANLIIFDNELSPVQVNNLDMAIGIKVIDRTELILQIFAKRARSAESQIQVELAQLEYLISRVPVSEKQSRFRGGIGMRGPGENPFQLRNAPMRRRIRDLRKKLALIQRRREISVTRLPWPTVCLVGYTNAGKSSMLNALAKSNAHVDDRLFATLDTKTRRVRLDNGFDLLLIDTVGFIRNLPHGLIASFRSTLDVAVKANMLIMVLEASHPLVEDHERVVNNTLIEIGAGSVPVITVLNKWDLVKDDNRKQYLLTRFPSAIPVSVKTGEGMSFLKEQLYERLKDVISYSNANR